MFALRRAIAFVVLIALAATLSAAEQKWQEVKKFKGAGIKNTETFTAPGKEWRVRWKIDDATNGAIIFVHDEKEALKAAMSSPDGEKEGSSIVRGKGKFYLNVVILVHWEVFIDENRTA